jgi:hypothetical protein
MEKLTNKQLEAKGLIQNSYGKNIGLVKMTIKEINKHRCKAYKYLLP